YQVQIENQVMNNIEIDENEETKEQIEIQQNPNSMIHYAQQLGNLDETNQISQIQQNNQNEISFNGFKIYYNDPSEVINILEQRKQAQEQQLNSQHQNDASQNKIIERICKVCFEGESVVQEKGELIYPCLCSGSCQYIHEQCLKTWIVSRGQNIFLAKCEICNYKYQIKCEQKKKLNLRYSLKQNQTGAIITIIFTTFFVISFGMLILFIIDIALTIASSNQAIINYDETLKFVALFIIFVFASGFFIGMIQSFKENCLFEHVVKWQIFNYDKNQLNEENQNQDDKNQTENNIQNQLNLIGENLPQQIQVSQQNNFDNSVYHRQETYSNLHNQHNGPVANQNTSYQQNDNFYQQQQQPQNIDSDQVSQWINYLRSKQITPAAFRENSQNDIAGDLNSAERLKMLELFGYQQANKQQQNDNIFIRDDKVNDEESKPRQISLNSKLQQIQNQNEIIQEKQFQESNFLPQKKSIDILSLQKQQYFDFNKTQQNQNCLDFHDQSIFQKKCKSTHVISINKINNNINYRDINNRSQLSYQQDENNTKAKTHFQFLQSGNYSQSIDYLRAQVIPPQFLTDQKKPNQYIDVILQCNE
ncbi:RING-variant domain protein, partial (macronuclear) [Tetrahymena thermophila SB210]